MNTSIASWCCSWSQFLFCAAYIFMETIENLYRQHHLGVTSIRCTFPAQAMVVVPGFSVGKPFPVTVSFLRTVSLKQFILFSF